MNTNNEQPKKSRGRKAGMKNKAYGVKLKDLVAFCNPEAIIPVTKSFALGLKSANASLDIREMDMNPSMPHAKEEVKLEFAVIESND
jgi:hypothetical protein